MMKIGKRLIKPKPNMTKITVKKSARDRHSTTKTIEKRRTRNKHSMTKTTKRRKQKSRHSTEKTRNKIGLLMTESKLFKNPTSGAGVLGAHHATGYFIYIKS